MSSIPNNASVRTGSQAETVHLLFAEVKFTAIEHALTLSNGSELAKQAIKDFVETFGSQSGMVQIANAAHLLIAANYPSGPVADEHKFIDHKLMDRFIANVPTLIQDHLLHLANAGVATSQEFAVEVAGLRFIFRDLLNSHHDHPATKEITKGVAEAESHLYATGKQELAETIRTTFKDAVSFPARS